jgi:hypothetical protein
VPFLSIFVCWTLLLRQEPSDPELQCVTAPIPAPLKLCDYLRLRLRTLGFTYYHCGSGSNKMVRLRFRNTAFTSCCVKLVKILENSMNIISGIGAGVAMYWGATLPLPVQFPYSKKTSLSLKMDEQETAWEVEEPRFGQNCWSWPIIQ